MSYSENIRKTLRLFMRNLGTILLVYLILSLIGFITASTLNISFGFNILDKSNIQSMAKDLANDSSTKSFFYTLLQGTLSLSILGTNQIGLLNLLRGGGYSINGLVEIFKNNYKDILLVAFLITFISKLVGLIPILGGIVAIIASLAFCFSFFLIYDFKAKGPDSYLKGSANITNGHKLRLFILNIIYGFVPIVLGAVLIITSIISKSLSLGIGGIIVSILLLTLTSLLSTIGQSVYYDELIKEKDPTAL